MDSKLNQAVTAGKTCVCTWTHSLCVHVTMQGEAYVDMVRWRRQNQLKERKLNLDGVFIPSSVPKKPSGVGSNYGTFGGRVNFFSSGIKPQEKYRAPGKNVLVNPSKKGTGYG